MMSELWMFSSANERIGVTTPDHMWPDGLGVTISDLISTAGLICLRSLREFPSCLLLSSEWGNVCNFACWRTLAGWCWAVYVVFNFSENWYDWSLNFRGFYYQVRSVLREWSLYTILSVFEISDPNYLLIDVHIAYMVCDLDNLCSHPCLWRPWPNCYRGESWPLDLRSFAAGNNAQLRTCRERK